MTRIVLVGAGSVEFTRNLLGDLLSYPELRAVGLLFGNLDVFSRFSTPDDVLERVYRANARRLIRFG